MKATDTAGGVGYSSVAVTVPVLPVPADTTAPTVRITLPTGGAQRKNVVPIAGTAEDNIGIAQVSVFIDNAQV